MLARRCGLLARAVQRRRRPPLQPLQPLQPQRWLHSQPRPTQPADAAARTVWRGFSTGEPAAAAEEPASALRHLMLVIPCSITLGLGCWQVFRLDWKRREIESRASTLTAESTALVDLLGAALLDEDRRDEAIELLRVASFQKVQLVGRFDHSSEVYVGARGMPGTNAETARGSGYIILTPMVLEAGGRRVLVNRGWVERGFKQPASRPAGQPEGVVAVEAVVRFGEKGAWYQPAGGGADRAWTWIDLAAISATTETVTGYGDTILFDSIQGLPPGPGELGAAGPIPRDLPSYMNFSVTPWKHMVYAGTWFTLSVSIVALYATRVWRKPAAIGAEIQALGRAPRTRKRAGR